MEGPSNDSKDNEKKSKNRFMGKFFKEKKPTANETDVDDFLHGPSDKLHMMPTSDSVSHPPHLTRIDTSSARRWPTAAEINSSRQARGRSASPKRNRKGRVVRFTEEQPEVIGEGGDEATAPVSDIGVRKRANTHPPITKPIQDGLETDRRNVRPPERGPGYGGRMEDMNNFRPGPVRRTQTGFESIPDTRGITGQDSSPGLPGGVEDDLNNFLETESHDPTSFAARVKAEMRKGEGKALVNAASHASPIDQHFPRPDSPLPDEIEITPELDELHINTMNNTNIAPPRSPGIPTQLEPGLPQTPKGAQNSSYLTESPAPISRTSILTLQEAALAVGDDALQGFSGRIAHLFTLFRLATESVKPLPKYSLEELVRAALWWFIKGRLNIEATIRDRPASPEAQQASFFSRQQAYADLAKSLWIIETVTPQYPELQQLGSAIPDGKLADIIDSRQGVLSNLRKLTMSMKRNNFLPPNPDDAPLQPGLDNSIWVVDDGNRSLVASQRAPSAFSLSDAFPLGDSSQKFHYGRMFVEAVLLEEAASQYYRCHVLLSVVRGVKENGLTATVASQDGLFNLSIQSEKARGPTWEEVAWQPKINTLEVKLPRGFVLRLHCAEQDFKTLWKIYDYHSRTHDILVQRPNEELIFETTVRTFQKFELSSQSVVPKEPWPHCHLKVFEKSSVEKAATGARTMHRGFRIALTSNPLTKNLRGIDQVLPPTLPIQFGFLRGDGGLPAFLLKIRDEKSKFNIVFTFDDVNERTRLHTLLAGVALGDGEDIVAEASFKAFSVASQTNNARDSKCLKALDWQSFRVINKTYGDIQSTKTVLSERLRLVLDFKVGTLTDRVNVGPGEYKFRLNVNTSNELRVLRQPQHDMTLSISESQVSKELPSELSELLANIAKFETARTYSFPSIKELHLFQTALTSFSVLFDGVAASFNISRRRMVVPIYKKWDAATTRVQIVQKEKVIQLVAFFENFSHGDCMNFTLKSTDIFESSGRSSKFSLRIVDAKFALPKARVEGESAVDHEFLCLDIPEYPGEHDDITIVFDTEADRDRFAEALPAAVKAASRMGSIRK